MRPKNIFILILDGLRRDRLSCLGYPRATTPFLDSLAGNATVFLRTWATSHSSLPCHISIFTGHTPQFHGVGSNLAYFDGSRPFLTEELRRVGYTTVGVSTKNPYLTTERGFIRHFDRYAQIVKSNRALHRKRGDILRGLRRASHRFRRGIREAARGLFSNPEKEFAKARREYADFYLRNDLGGGKIVETTMELFRWARRRGGPFFVFTNILEPHSPYLPPAGFREAFGPVEITENLSKALYDTEFVKSGRVFLTDAEKETLGRLYDGGVRYTDHLVERLFGTLRREGLFDGVTVFIMSDHGEMLNEHDTLIGHGPGIHPGLIHVPLLVWEEGGDMRRVDRPTSIADVFPTVLRLAGVAGSHRPYGSEDLFAPNGERAFVVAESPAIPFAEKILADQPGYIARWIFGERARITRDRVFIWRANGAHLLYAWNDWRTNLFEADRETARAAVRDLEAWYASGPADRRPFGLEHFEFNALEADANPPDAVVERFRREQPPGTVEVVADEMK